MSIKPPFYQISSTNLDFQFIIVADTNNDWLERRNVDFGECHLPIPSSL